MMVPERQLDLKEVQLRQQYQEFISDQVFASFSKCKQRPKSVMPDDSAQVLGDIHKDLNDTADKVCAKYKKCQEQLIYNYSG